MGLYFIQNKHKYFCSSTAQRNSAHANLSHTHILEMPDTLHYVARQNIDNTDLEYAYLLQPICFFMIIWITCAKCNYSSDVHNLTTSKLLASSGQIVMKRQMPESFALSQTANLQNFTLKCASWIETIENSSPRR